MNSRVSSPALCFAVLVGTIVGLMLMVVFYLSFYEGLPGIPGGFLTTAHYTELLKDRLAYRVLTNTLIYTGIAIFISLLFGVLIAWLVERTDIRGRNLIYTGMTLGLLIPTFFPSMGWLFLLHPRIGFLNVYLKQFVAEDLKINIATPIGMGWVEGITLAPVVFIMVAANLRMADTTLEEAAKAAGANGWQLFKSIILPLSTPATMAAAFYVAAIAVASFDVPAIIGLSNRVYTLGTFIYEDLVPHQGFPQYGRPAAVSTLLILIGSLLSRVVSARDRPGQPLSAGQRQRLPAAALSVRQMESLRRSIRRLVFLGTNVRPGRSFALGRVSTLRAAAVRRSAWTIERGEFRPSALGSFLPRAEK